MEEKDMKKVISTDKAPAAVGPYSQGIDTGQIVFLSGQLGIDPATGKFAGNDVESQATQVFKNIKALLVEAGLGMNNVVKATLFLKDMADFKRVNAIYAENFDQPYPARSAVAVRELPLGGEVEIEVIAYR
jgi:2-iminobutanoate/2-iminopropanoate deaminase